MPGYSGSNIVSRGPGDPGPAEPPAVVNAVHTAIDMLTVVLCSLEQLRRQPLDERGQLQLDRAEWGAQQAAQIAQQILTSDHAESVTTGIGDLSEHGR